MAAPMKKRPQRTCVVCRTKRDKSDLIRIVASPDGEVRYDPTGRAPGRGAYLCKDQACVEAELQKTGSKGKNAGRLKKSLKHEVSGEEIDSMAQEILKKALESADGNKGNKGNKSN